MNESVARRLAALRWLPNTPPLTAWPNGEWADSMGTDLNIWTVAVDSGPCSRVRCTHPIMHYIRIRWNGKGTAFRDQRIVALVSVPQTHDVYMYVT